jgi:hypothetical protein
MDIWRKIWKLNLLKIFDFLGRYCGGDLGIVVTN